jgi:predicted XRE-type DNA-binding protein
VNRDIHALLESLTPEERTGKTLKVRVPQGTPTPSRPARALGDEAQAVVATRAVGEALSRARKQAGLKAKDVAAALKVSAPRIAQIESLESNPTLLSVVEHASAVGYEVEIVLRPRNPKLALVVAPLSATGKATARKQRSTR